MADPAVERLMSLAELSGETARIVATHNGRAHNDEIVGVSILSLVFPFLIVLRTRDEREWLYADYLLDISGRYDGKKHFDHHQEAPPPYPRANGVRYATAGLVFRHFGLRWLRPIGVRYRVGYSELASALDEELIQGFDFNDTGRTLDFTFTKPQQLAAVAPDWRGPKDPDPLNLISGPVNSPMWETEAERNAAFGEAVNHSATLILGKAHDIAEAMTIPRKLEAALRQTKDPRILQIDCRLRRFDLARDSRFDAVERVVFEDLGTYRVVAIKRHEKTLLFPETWFEHPPFGLRFLREDRLYIGAATLEDAMRLATLSLRPPLELTPPEPEATRSEVEEGCICTRSYINELQLEIFSDLHVAA